MIEFVVVDLQHHLEVIEIKEKEAGLNAVVHATYLPALENYLKHVHELRSSCVNRILVRKQDILYTKLWIRLLVNSYRLKPVSEKRCRISRYEPYGQLVDPIVSRSSLKIIVKQ